MAYISAKYNCNVGHVGMELDDEHKMLIPEKVMNRMDTVGKLSSNKEGSKAVLEH